MLNRPDTWHSAGWRRASWRRASWRRAGTWLAGLATLLVAAAVMRIWRHDLDKAHIALVFLLVVLGGSAAGGQALGLVLALGGFVLFDVLFLQPYNTFVVAEPLDWLVLVAYLATGIVAAQLLARAQREAAQARQRAVEVDRLAALGAESLSAPRAEDALVAIARVVADALAVAQCDVFPCLDDSVTLAPAIPTGDHADDLVAWVARERRAAWRLDDGTTRTTAPNGPLLDHDTLPTTTRGHELLLPLQVQARVVGVLRLADPRGISLDPTRQRYLEALAHYAALSVERWRLAGEAESAAALREADKLKDALLATVSHDLRTPLTTIRGLAHDIAESGDDRGWVIEEESMRLNALVSDLLDLSRLNAGNLPLDLALNTADDLMGAALQRVGGAVGTHVIHAAIDPSEPLLVGRFDLAHAVRILGNLLENAIKYSPADTSIDFTVRRDGAWLLFEVADRGPGVPEAERERIFRPFYRASAASPDVGGAGLGLAIARGLAEAQGGALTVRERTGGGSVFALSLPAFTGVK